VRVLVVTNDLPPRVGGIQYYVDQLARGLVAAGDEVVLFGSSSEGAEAWDASAPYEVVRQGTSVLLPTPSVRHRVHRLVRSTGAEVVVFGAAFPLGLMGPGVRARTGVPYLAFTHGLEVSAVRAPGGWVPLRRIGDGAGAITYVSHWCRRLLEPAFGPRSRHVMLPPAVDPREYHRGVDGRVVRRRFGVDDGDPLVVCVSRLVPRKGQDVLIAGLGELRRRVPGARLMIVGGGPHEAALRRQAEEQGVGEHVVFTGMVSGDELPAHFAAADVFAMPCRERRRGLEVEAFGIVFIQAEAVGVPVVAGAIGGVPDSLDAGGTGVLVDGTDERAVTDAVAGLLGDEDRRRRMGAAAARFVAEGFTWPRRTEQLRGLLDEVVGSRPSG
jgi:phosphatidylinositol alpha-1,6-mannosyltransferase